MTITLTAEELDAKQKHWQMRIEDYRLALLNEVEKLLMRNMDDIKKQTRYSPSQPEIKLI